MELSRSEKTERVEKVLAKLKSFAMKHRVDIQSY